MGTISDKLMRIINTKEDIRQALISKGYDVPTSIPFKEYAKMILDLPCKVDSFPDIEGIVARYSASGFTNEQMAANPVWVDKTGNGHDLQLKNFAWKGMSGVGGYVQDFNDFRNNATVDKIRIDEQGSNSIKVTILTTGIGNAIYIPKNIYQFNKSYFIKISSEGYDEGDLFLSFYAPSTSTATTVKVPLNSNGITEIPAIKEDDFLAVYLFNAAGKVGSITIEQLPLCPGFILGDGVDDFAVTEKELNFEDTYTVYTAFIPFQNNPARNMILCGKNDTKDFTINYSGTHLNFKPSTGVNLAVRIDQFALLVCKRNKDITTIINLSTGESRSLKSVEFISNPGLYYLWRNVFATFHARAAIAGQTICNGYFSTDEDDEKVLDWYKKQYPWLFPDQAWTVVGKTNEDEDRATIANITGNGNDLVLSNFGFAEGSGYNEEGEYAGYLVTDGVDDQMNSSNFDLGKDFTIIGEWKFMNNIIANAGISKALSLFVYNTDNGLRVFINNTTKGPVLNTKTLKAICSDGRVYSDDWSEMIINEEQPITSSKSSLLIGINGNNFAKIALKNLAIYNQILSKDDCIKAYSYLQTLKAK